MTETTSPKRRPRVSLLNLLLLMTIAAMAVALWRLNGELVPLRSEVRKLRNEVGYLYIEDPGRFYALRVATEDADHFRYRVWVPEGRQYWLWRTDRRIPQQGTAEQGSGATIEPGEHLIDIKLRPDEEDKNRLMATVLVDGKNRMSGTVNEQEQDWISNDEIGSRLAAWHGVQLEAQSFDAPGPVVLLRMRAQRITNIRRDEDGRVRGHSWEEIQDPTDGLMLWLAEEEGPNG